MTPQALAASAAQAQAQGNQMLQSDQSNASNYQGQYNTAYGQAQSANQDVQNYTNYMAGAGSGANQYNTQLSNLTQQYNPNIQGQLSGANQSLFGLTGALNGASQAFNKPGGVGAYGLSAPALAGYENSVTAPLQQGVANANTQVNALNGQLGTLMTGANQATTAQIQGEQNTLGGYQDVYANAQNQASQAMNNMQFYSQLAQQQGGLNAQQQQYYAQSISALQSAQAAMTQANAAAQTAAAQSAQINQSVSNTSALQAQLKSMYGNNWAQALGYVQNGQSVPSYLQPGSSGGGGGITVGGSGGLQVGAGGVGGLQ